MTADQHLNEAIRLLLVLSRGASGMRDDGVAAIATWANAHATVAMAIHMIDDE